MIYGEFELVRKIEDAQQVPIAGLFTSDDLKDDYDRLYDNGQPGGQFTGWY
jgi:hypothetical protein